jgi:lipopolysaccharide transport system permease protein
VKPSLGHSVELVRALVSKEFSVRYKSTILGFVWSLANPVFFALVFYIAFRHILRVPVENYFAFLLAGLFPWQWFANAVTSSPMVYISNGGLIKKVYFPRILLPMATAGNQLVHFLLALLVSIPILAIQGTYPSIHWALGIPLLLLLQATVILGISILLASLNIFFRDLEHLTAILTNLIFYMTPVFYPE